MSISPATRPSFVIAAPSSGAGKTMVSLGLMRTLADRGVTVAPFKCGPDYIDTQFHTAACRGRRSVNLDLFMGSVTHVTDIFARHSAGAEVAVVEGAMGMFDGYDRDLGSASHIARTLGLPVVAVVDGRSTSFTAGAVLYGLGHFRSGTRIAGVIFNRVGSARHASMLTDAAREAGVPVLGCIGRRTGLQTPSRHLGLTLTGRGEMESFVAEAARAVAEGVDTDMLLRATSCALPSHPATTGTAATEPTWRVGVARDECFSFIYEANLDSLRRHGAEIVFFSPLRDTSLPDCLDMLYLPGGYPELYTATLAGNTAMRHAIRRMALGGGRILAECGGLIYLSESIDGAAMCGVLPTRATMEGAKLTLGYRSVRMADGNIWRGHEFHYSHLTDPAALPSVAVQTDALGRETSTPLYRHLNTIAGYTHLYWGEADIRDLWK